MKICLHIPLQFSEILSNQCPISNIRVPISRGIQVALIPQPAGTDFGLVFRNFNHVAIRNKSFLQGSPGVFLVP